MKRSIAVMALALISAGAFAQISFTGNYSEDFNTWAKEDSPGVIEGVSLPWQDNVTVAGWYQGIEFGGSIFPSSELIVGQSAGLMPLHTLGTPFDEDRAIGSGMGWDFGTGVLSTVWGFQLQNNTGSAIGSVDIEFDVENWLRPHTETQGFPAEQNVTFGQYRVGGTDFALMDFTSASQLDLTSLAPVTGNPAPIDGNLPQNRSHVLASLTGLNWQPGESLWIRWQDPDNLNRDAMFGIDNLSVVGMGAPVPEPATLLLLGAGSALLTLRKRKRS